LAQTAYATARCADHALPTSSNLFQKKRP
jgi:hypothetical protein